MKKHTKNSFFSLILFSSFLTPIFMTSCHTNDTTNTIDETSQYLDEAYKSFSLSKSKSVSNIVASSIQTEKDLSKYFSYEGTKPGVLYKFTGTNVSQSSSGILNVNFELSLPEKGVYSKNKSFQLEGFRNISKEFDIWYESFSLIEKNNVDINDIFNPSIDNNQQKLFEKYYTTPIPETELKYEFISSKYDASTNAIDVEFKLISAHDESLFKNKIIKLTNENNTGKEFDDAVNSFELIKKPNIDVSDVLDTSITTEEKLLEYFSFPKHENIKYEFIQSTVNETTNLLDVTYKITSMLDTNLTTEKTVSLSLEGFKNAKRSFENAYNNFNLIKKENIDINDIFNSSIDNNEQKLFEKYYIPPIIETELKYEFINSKYDASTNTIDVEFKLISVYDESLFKNKIIKLTNEKNTEKEFENAYNNFNLIKKENIDLSTISSSSIKTEQQLLKYFTIESNSDITYEFMSAKVNNSNKNEIIVKYRLTSNIDENLNRVKILNISGFDERDQGLINQIKENEKILNEVLQLIKIESVQNHADISAREFVENENSFNRYFRINTDAISDLASTVDIKVSPFATYKRDLNNYTNVIFTVNAFVGSGSARVSGKREVVIGGFKSLVTGLDVKPSPSITLPVNAVSYKGKLEPVVFKELGQNAYDGRITKFSFEQLKYELMYQLRFWMYQMFSDNFSELDYWIEGGKKGGDPLTAVIEGVVLNDVNNLVYWCQQIGNANAVTNNLKTGQRIKIKVSLLEPQNWKPHGRGGVFGHLNEIKGFSFVKGCANIDVSKNDKGAYATTLPISSLNVTVDGRTTISVSRWTSFGSVMFTIGGTRSKKI